MKKLLMAVAALLPLCAGLMAQNLDDSDIFLVKDDQLHSALDSIVVSASRVDAKSPVVTLPLCGGSTARRHCCSPVTVVW